jgi:hypothetical protein
MDNFGDDFHDETLAAFGALKKRAKFFTKSETGHPLHGIKINREMALMEGEVICFPLKMDFKKVVITHSGNLDLS